MSIDQLAAKGNGNRIFSQNYQAGDIGYKVQLPDFGPDKTGKGYGNYFSNFRLYGQGGYNALDYTLQY